MTTEDKKIFNPKETKEKVSKNKWIKENKSKKEKFKEKTHRPFDKNKDSSYEKKGCGNKRNVEKNKLIIDLTPLREKLRVAAEVRSQKELRKKKERSEIREELIYKPFPVKLYIVDKKQGEAKIQR
jgi:hypothetical protein